MRKEARNISIKIPRAMEALLVRVVTTAMGPGNMHELSAAATMQPSSSAGKRNRLRMGGTLPMMTRARRTCVEGGNVSVGRRIR